MAHLYDEIGGTRVINASGSMTYLGGSLIAPEVLEKMREAAGAFVVMEELMELLMKTSWVLIRYTSRQRDGKDQ